MSIGLYEHQLKAIGRMKNGCILNGGVGTGKSRTGLGYYYKTQGGNLYAEYPKMINPKNLFIITTARKRDTKEWEGDMVPFLMSTDPELNKHGNEIVVDSWNNIKKYENVKDQFFIFDEQKAIGKGTWAKTFIKICKSNDWIMLSATAGDCWTDYIPVFIANGFYRNRTEFIREHIEYEPTITKYPKIKAYHNTGRLQRLRNSILIDMNIDRPTVVHHEDIYCGFNLDDYKVIFKDRWNYEEDKPIESATELCYQLRKVINSHEDRLMECKKIYDLRKRVIIFYNFDYELDLLKNFEWGNDCVVAEWNGHQHQPIPDSEYWVYLVQYNAGAEGWNCVKTDTIIFYSQTYSYKTLEQAAGRIDRLNTPFIDLYYYHLKSRSGIDVAISKAIKTKKKFNESRFIFG